MKPRHHPHSHLSPARSSSARSGSPQPGPVRTRIDLYISRLPGVAVCAVATAIAFLLSLVVPYVGPVLIAIVLGILVRNLLPAIPAVLQPGIGFTSTTLLRLGIVLLGFRLVLGDIVGLGWGVIAIIVAVVAFGFLAAILVGRILGVGRDVSLLIGSGFSICGAAAVAGAESTLRAKKEDTAAALALVVLFGTSMIAVVPAVAGGLGLSQHEAGLWAGASTHEVAQVAAIGGILGPDALKVATLVKLGRVVLLAPLMLVLGAIVARADRKRDKTVAAEAAAGSAGANAGQDAEAGPATDSADQPADSRPPILPMWVVGFIVAAVIATTFHLPAGFTSAAGTAQSLLLTGAMFGLGTGVHFKSLVQVGLRPVVLALLTTCVVAGVAGLGVWLVS